MDRPLNKGSWSRRGNGEPFWVYLEGTAEAKEIGHMYALGAGRFEVYRYRDASPGKDCKSPHEAEAWILGREYRG